jgi:hypothetical protein
MVRRVLSALSGLCLCLAASVSSGSAAETVWSGIVMANNVTQPTPIPPELKSVETTLKHLFGYNQFQVIGQSRQTLKTGEEDWVASSKYFSLHIDSKAAAKSAPSYLLNLQLFQEQKLLLETEAKLSKRSPLVIKGPQVGDGQLVLLLVVE